MDNLAAQFMRAASGHTDCASPVFACAPKFAAFADALPADKRGELAHSVDVLGAACSVARMAGVEPIALTPDVPAWGVAYVAGGHTLCMWDGRTVWAQGRTGATRLRVRHVVMVWSLD